MARDIINDLVEPINEELHELNINIVLKEEKRPQIWSKRRLVAAADYGPLVEAFIRKYMDDTVDKTFGIRFKNEQKILIGNKIIRIRVTILLSVMRFTLGHRVCGIIIIFNTMIAKTFTRRGINEVMTFFVIF